MKSLAGRQLIVSVLALALALVGATAAGAAKPDPSKRVVPVWAGIKHGKPVKGGLVTVRTRSGKLLAGPARTDRKGATTLVARKPLPRAFYVEVRRAAPKRAKRKAARGKARGKAARRKATRAKRGRLMLRSAVRGWRGTRVVYVNPYTTIVAAYMQHRPKVSPARAEARVKRHLGLRRVGDPASSTFRARHIFSPQRYAGAAAKRGGPHTHARRIAKQIEGKPRLERFAPQRRRAKARASAVATSGSADLNATRLQTERELLAAAQAALNMATGSPGALLQIGKLLDALLGGGDLAELKLIATQLQSIQTGIDNVEHQVAQVDSEVSLAAYSAAVENYATRQGKIDKLWEQYTHAVALASTADSANAKLEAQALQAGLAGWDDQIQSSYLVPDNANAPGLMTWAQNSLAKNSFSGMLTAANQPYVSAAGFQWWSYWVQDIALHFEKWNSPTTIGGQMTPDDAASVATTTHDGLIAASDNGYGADLPATLVYAVNLGRLYSVGTTWNIKPDVAPPAPGNPDWGLLTKEEAAALPADADALMNALIVTAPEGGTPNPNASMSGKFGSQANNGTWPSYAGTGGGYGVPPKNTSTFALNASTNGGCVGEWQYYANAQGSSNTTGAPIIEFCPALDAVNQAIVDKTCTQILLPGQFFAWSDSYPEGERAQRFTTCNDYDYWENASNDDPSLNWGTGVFLGSKPLSKAIVASPAPSAYFGLWSRPVGNAERFLVGPVSNSG